MGIVFMIVDIMMDMVDFMAMIMAVIMVMGMAMIVIITMVMIMTVVVIMVVTASLVFQEKCSATMFVMAGDRFSSQILNLVLDILIGLLDASILSSYFSLFIQLDHFGFSPLLSCVVQTRIQIIYSHGSG